MEVARASLVLAVVVALGPAAGGCKRSAPTITTASARFTPWEPFEGEVEYVSAAPGPILRGERPAHTIAKIGDHRCRWEVIFDGARVGSSTLDDDLKMRSYVLDANSQTYRENLFPQARPQPRAVPTKGFVKTGEKDIVAGYTCEVAVWRMPTFRTEVCVSREAGLWGVGPFATMIPGEGGSLLRELGFPLRLLVFGATDELLFGDEAIRVEKKSIPQSDVEVPPGYAKAPPLPERPYDSY